MHVSGDEGGRGRETGDPTPFAIPWHPSTVEPLIWGERLKAHAPLPARNHDHPPATFTHSPTVQHAAHSSPRSMRCTRGDEGGGGQGGPEENPHPHTHTDNHHTPPHHTTPHT